jgi:hypothetical protein
MDGPPQAQPQPQPEPEPEEQPPVPPSVRALIALAESQTSQASSVVLDHLATLAALAKSGELRDEEDWCDELVRASMSMLQSVLRRGLDNLSLGEEERRPFPVIAPLPAVPVVPAGGGDEVGDGTAGVPPLAGRPPRARGSSRRPPKGTALRIGSGTPMTVAPWARGGGAGGGRGGKRGARPMTVAPWARGGAAGRAPGLTQLPMALRSNLAAGRSIAGAIDACNYVRGLVNTPECLELLQQGGIQPVTLRQTAAVGSSAARHLGSIGTNSTSLLAQVLRAQGVDAQLPAKLVDALLGLLHSLYSQFIAVRPPVRATVIETMLSAAQRLGALSALSVGARLHSMDGGPRPSGIDAAGLIALLEFCCAMARGYKQPLAQRHQHLLWEIALPLHVPDNAVDDTTPVLQLYHRPLTLWCSGLLRKSPGLFPRFIEVLVTAHWPSASGSNSTKEVLLLHELEQMVSS